MHSPIEVVGTEGRFAPDENKAEMGFTIEGAPVPLQDRATSFYGMKEDTSLASESSTAGSATSSSGNQGPINEAPLNLPLSRFKSCLSAVSCFQEMGSSVLQRLSLKRPAHPAFAHLYDKISKFREEEEKSYIAGSHRLARLQSRSGEDAICRKFKLESWHTIVDWEIKLQKLSDAITASSRGNPNDGDVTPDEAEAKKAALQLLKDTMRGELFEYWGFLLRFHEISTLQPPSHRDLCGFVHRALGHNCLNQGQGRFIFSINDFVSLEPIRVSFGPINRLIKECIMALTYLSPHRRRRGEYHPRPGNIYLASRVDFIARIVNIILTIMLYMLPVGIFLLLELDAVAMFIITFILVFFIATILTFFSDMKTEGVFVGVAAYTSVLAVFLGNLSL